MRVSVSSRALSIDDEVRKEICSRIYFAVSRFSPHMSEVKAEVEQIIGIHRRTRLLCRLTVKMKDLGCLEFESTEDELATAVSLAAARAARKIQRLLAHERDKNQWSKL